MRRLHCLMFALMLLAVMSLTAGAAEKIIRVGVVQTVIEPTVDANRIKIVNFIQHAADAKCDLAVFPENGLYWPDIATHKPTRAQLDDAIERIRVATKEAGLAVAFGVAYLDDDDKTYQNRVIVFGDDGEQLMAYWKNRQVPRAFEVDGVRCNVSICSDRWYLEHSDLPCLVSGSQIIIDTSGGHGGDDGGPMLPLVRYRPWAARTGAWVIVSNPVHDDTDFMGRSPWGGGSAVIRPDGSVFASRKYQKEELLISDIPVDAATRYEAARRSQHPLLHGFWDMGRRVMDGERLEKTPDLAPYRSAVRDVKIAAAQIAASPDIAANTRMIVQSIERAADEKADIVVFPELALTGAHAKQIEAATADRIESSLRQIADAAKNHGIYAIVGTPFFDSGVRRNGAVVIDDHGAVLTRYGQVATDRVGLFEPGRSAAPMWFQFKGVYAIVTIGNDAEWVEIADLAATRGMSLHFHITADPDPSTDAALLRKQRNIVSLSYAQFGAIVNFAEGGGSMIVSREGGHEKPAPKAVEYYLPYQTSIIKSAAAGEEKIIYATRRTAARNNLDLDRHWRNRNRKSRDESSWFEWIKAGARMIEADAPSTEAD